MTAKDIYLIRSKITGKYLSNLFEDSHNKMFQAKEPKIKEVYFYENKQTASEIAKELNAEVRVAKYQNGNILYTGASL